MISQIANRLLLSSPVLLGVLTTRPAPTPTARFCASSTTRRCGCRSTTSRWCSPTDRGEPEGPFRPLRQSRAGAGGRACEHARRDEHEDPRPRGPRPHRAFPRAQGHPAPRPDPTAARIRASVEGDAPSALASPPGCAFHPRYPIARPVCSERRPELREVEGARVACHFAEEAPSDLLAGGSGVSPILETRLAVLARARAERHNGASPDPNRASPALAPAGEPS